MREIKKLWQKKKRRNKFIIELKKISSIIENLLLNWTFRSVQLWWVHLEESSMKIKRTGIWGKAGNQTPEVGPTQVGVGGNRSNHRKRQSGPTAGKGNSFQKSPVQEYGRSSKESLPVLRQPITAPHLGYAHRGGGHTALHLNLFIFHLILCVWPLLSLSNNRSWTRLLTGSSNFHK